MKVKCMKHVVAWQALALDGLLKMTVPDGHTPRLPRGVSPRGEYLRWSHVARGVSPAPAAAMLRSSSCRRGGRLQRPGPSAGRRQDAVRNGEHPAGSRSDWNGGGGGRRDALVAAVHEDGVHQEDDAVDDGQGGLGQAVVAQLALAQVLEVLDGQGAGRDEQRAAQQAEVDVDAPVDGGAGEQPGEHPGGDDEVAAEGGGRQHEGRLRVREAVVVEPHAGRGQRELQELDEGESADGHFDGWESLVASGVVAVVEHACPDRIAWEKGGVE